MRCVVKLKLHLTPEQKSVLLSTVHQYAACFNEVAHVGWQGGSVNGVELHKATYYPLRAEYPDMPAQLVISARMKAIEALKAVFARKKQGRKATCPKSRYGAIRYDARTYAFWPDKQTCSLSTLAGRQHVAVSVPEYFRPAIAGATSFDSADLVYHRGKDAFWLHLVVTLPETIPSGDGPVIGVDVGMTRLAVTSANLFVDGRRVKEVANRYFRLRRSLQSKGARSAKRKLKAVRHREQRFRNDVNHRVSKRIVSSLSAGATIVLEDLTHIRDRVKNAAHPAISIAG
jgi:predicted transposase